MNVDFYAIALNIIQWLVYVPVNYLVVNPIKLNFLIKLPFLAKYKVKLLSYGDYIRIERTTKNSHVYTRNPIFIINIFYNQCSEAEANLLIEFISLKNMAEQSIN